jgi:hypothetical protein
MRYVDPTSNKFAMLPDLRVRDQGPNDSLGTFLTEAGARLKAMGYPRELWLDLIYPVLLPSIQNVLQGFATHITSYDELLAECDRMECTARSVQPPPSAISAINAAQLIPFQHNDSQLLESIDQLQASIARLNVESPQNSNNQRDQLISIHLLGVSIVILQGMYSVIVGKSVMIWLGVGISLILIKTLFQEELLFKMNANLIGADHKIVAFQASLTEISLMTGIDRPIGKISLHLTSAALLLISFRITVILLYRGKTRYPHT